MRGTRGPWLKIFWGTALPWTRSSRAPLADGMCLPLARPLPTNNSAQETCVGVGNRWGYTSSGGSGRGDGGGSGGGGSVMAVAVVGGGGSSGGGSVDGGDGKVVNFQCVVGDVVGLIVGAVVGLVVGDCDGLLVGLPQNKH
jgi:hypothetical protein